ncbi:unnamed protein product [Calypogeia fissa]
MGIFIRNSHPSSSWRGSTDIDRPLQQASEDPLQLGRSLLKEGFKEHEPTMTMVEAERRKRENYRPVLGRDGLIWHRSQLERKKLKRNPAEVLRDLIVEEKRLLKLEALDRL